MKCRQITHIRSNFNGTIDPSAGCDPCTPGGRTLADYHVAIGKL